MAWNLMDTSAVGAQDMFTGLSEPLRSRCPVQSTTIAQSKHSISAALDSLDTGDFQMLRHLIPAMLLLMASTQALPADSGGMNMKGMQSSGAAMGSHDMGDMKSMSDQPAHFKAKDRTYTTNHAFLVKIVSLPNPIPYEKHFNVALSVFDGKHTDRKLTDATVRVTGGMRHGMKSGFAHGMQYAPRVESKDGTITVAGLFFHMMGTWTLQVDVENGANKGTAYLDLPCCAQ